MKKIIGFLISLVFGYYENEPIESTFKNLKKFVSKHGGYELLSLIQISDEKKRLITEMKAQLDTLPESQEKEVLESLFTTAEAHIFTDNLELMMDSVQQRIVRVRLKSILGEYAKAKGHYGKKLSPRRRKKYENMLDLWDTNRMRKNFAINWLNYHEMIGLDSDCKIKYGDDVTEKFQALKEGAFRVAPDGKMGVVYDYLKDEEKIKLRDQVDEFLFCVARDTITYLQQQSQPQVHEVREVEFELQ